MEEEEEKIIDNNLNKEGIISESDLLDVYDFQYNDIFSKILKINEEQFFALLQEQVLLNLRIINKLSDLSLMSYFQEFIVERYKTEKKKIENDLDKIKNLPENELIYLDYTNCYIHCHKNLKALHKCLNRLILYEGFIYCINCNKVYNENQIKLYCNECDEPYFSKLRINVDETNIYFYPVVFAKNHCQQEFDEEEKIKCLECGEELYYDLSKIKEEKYKYKKYSDLIKEIICIKCKLIYDTREIRFNCSICNNDFMSDAKLYNDFPIYKKKILYLIHTLRKDKLALPENYNGKKCKCDINLFKEFFHEEDNGILLQGYKDEKNKIVCKQCFEIYDADKYEWKCPTCGEIFKCVKPVENNNIIKSRNRSLNNKYKREDKNENMNGIKEDNKNKENIVDNFNKDIKEDNKIEIKEDNKIGIKNENKIEIKNDGNKIEIKDNNKIEIKNGYKIENKNDKKDNKNEENEFKVEIKNENKKDKNEGNEIKSNNKKEEKYKEQYEYNYNSLDSDKIIKNDNSVENNNNIKNEENNYKNQNKININNRNNINVSNYHSNNNKYNNQSNKINNNYKNYDEKDNKNNHNRYNYKDNYKKVNTQIKEDEGRSNREVKEIYKNVSTKVIIDTKSNNSNNNSISNRKVIDNQKRKDNVIICRHRNRNNIYNIRQNHQIININETSKRVSQKRNSALLEKPKKEVQNTEDKENKDNNGVENKNNEEEFNNIKKYFEDFNEEFEKDLESKNRAKQMKKEKRDKEYSNKNLRIHINVDNKNHIKHNISNIHNINNMHNIYHVSNKIVNDTKNKNNFRFTDNSNAISNKKIRRPLNNSRENKKDTKKTLSSNKIERKNDLSQNISKRRNNGNLKITSCNSKEKNDNTNNSNNRQKPNNLVNDKIDKNNNYNRNEQQQKMSKKYEINKKEEDVSKSEKKEIENKNEIKQEPEVKNEVNSTYTQITINSNNYKNVRVLGQGSYGKIYLVEDMNTKEQYAMKKLILGDKLELRDNQDEFNMIMQITASYPELNIIHVYGTETKNFDEYNFVFYVLMEVANCDWEKELLNRSKHKAYYTEDEIFYILESLVDTFAYLQQIGICHRDIKPQNILCFGEKGYKISDFGEAKYRKKWRLQQTSVNYTSVQTVRGTELYMSPILYTALKSCPNKGANHNVFKSDVFSLGMCFLFASCLDYKSLYEIRKVNNMKKLTDLVEHCVNGKYSQNFIDILLCMLQINEKERPDFIELSSMI